MAGRRLRAWQEAALARYRDLGEPVDYLVTATPGAGKTTFALTLARDLLDRQVVRRVIVVAPTDHLRAQWAENAAAFGIFLDPTLGNDVKDVTVDYHGYATTYAQVAVKPMLHDFRTTAARTLVIFDEIHHAGDGLLWGDAVREAFDGARRRLCLTGTPFRTSATETIPFVSYADDGGGEMKSSADYTYGYRHALADRVVRPVAFAAYSGVARWRNSAGEVVAASLTDADTSREAQQHAWRTALNPAGQWIPHVFAAADARLREVRQQIPDAAGMVLASNQDDARAYAEVLTRVTGVSPVVVTSDDPHASTRIEQFTRSTDPWLISVRLVSEGVDIPRLMVGVFATTTSTPLFFAQVIGRFVRARAAAESATVFLPAVRKVLALAAELEAERDHVLATKKPDDEEGLDAVPVEPPERSETDLGFEALDAEAEFAHVLYGGRAVTGDGATVVLSEADEEYLGLPGLLDPAQMAVLLRQREAEVKERVATRGVADLTPSELQQQQQQAAAIRREINSLVARVAARQGMPHAKVHALLRREVPGPPSASATVDQLARRRDHLLGLL